jgi:hypothetical protein
MKKAAYIALAAVVLLLAQSMPGEAHFRGNIWIGPVWGPGYWGPSYAYPYSYPYYTPPPVVIQQEPQEYIQQAPPPKERFWYYCPDPQGYYPKVEKCPKGWMKVVPNTAQPETGE